MKVLYDSQIFASQKFGGISRYFYELIKHLDSDIEAKVPLLFSNNEYISQRDISSHYSFFDKTEFRGKFLMMRKLNHLSFICSNKKDVNLVHPTYYDPRFLNSIGKTPFVLTVYDMIHERYAHVFSPNNNQ